MDHANLRQARGVAALRAPWNRVMLIPGNISLLELAVA